ncbi:MAG: AEC family transporter [Marivivens sp.]|nr:AEC family transporter [Marivivens sp.]
MNLALTVIQIAAPVFLLAAIGFAWVRLGFEYKMEFVTRLAMTVSLPALVFVAVMNTEIEPEALGRLLLASFVAYGAIGAILFIIIRLLRLDIRTFLAPLTFGNTGNLGLPLALFAFGQTGFSYALVPFAVMMLLSFSLGIWVVAGRGSLGRIVREPLMGALFLGALFLWQGWKTPVFMTNTLELLGQIAIPVMLITLGVAVARLHPGQVRLAVLLSVIKFGICVAVGVGVGLWFGLEQMPLAVLTLQLATPVAVTSYLLAEKFGADAQSVAGMVVVSTLLSVVGLPLILAFAL